jgi:fumarate reductase flavoprotein subunit
VEIFKADVVIVGGGGAGLRAAIAVAESDPSLKIALVSKVYPMRSHTVAAEGGAAGVKRDDDSFDYHFHDTVGGGDWLCEQDVVEYFVKQAPIELTQLEHWGCPWSRTPEGKVNVRPFGGMKIQRTWFAADKSGFHILHTLFQTSIKYPSIKRFDEYFCVDLLEEDGRCQGVVAIEMGTGEFVMIEGKSVILATGGAGRVFRESTLGGIVTGDGMALAFRHGVALRDMEFVQYHPTCMPITGLLFTEACRGEGGYLVNKDGYRYLQDYGLGPLQDKPKNKYMELGPRDRLSQAFWYEQQKGRTIEHPVMGSVVHLDLRHLGEAYLRERLPLIYEMAETFMGLDPAKDPIPVRPGVHYTMGGVKVDGNCETSLPGLFAIGECASVGIHGANRLGSNSLTELLVFGKVAGDQAVKKAKSLPPGNSASLLKQAQAAEAARHGTEDQDWRYRAHCRHPQGNGQDDGRRLRHLPRRGNHAGDLRQAGRAARALQEHQHRRQVERLEYRLADGHRTGLPARRGAVDGALGGQPQGIARRPPASRRPERSLRAA